MRAEAQQHGHDQACVAVSKETPIGLIVSVFVDSLSPSLLCLKIKCKSISDMRASHSPGMACAECTSLNKQSDASNAIRVCKILFPYILEVDAYAGRLHSSSQNADGRVTASLFNSNNACMHDSQLQTVNTITVCPRVHSVSVAMA